MTVNYAQSIEYYFGDSPRRERIIDLDNLLICLQNVEIDVIRTRNEKVPLK